MTAGISSVLVVIPARDEEELLPRCLDALAGSIEDLRDAHPSVRIGAVVVADRTTDGTHGIVARSFTAALLVVELGNVGAARRAGIAHLLRPGARAASTWIATTDADSVVPRDWLRTQVDLAIGGADLVVGGVTPEPQGLSLAQREAWDAFSRLPDPTGDIHGANLGIRASVYRKLGGFGSLVVGEDVDLVTRAVAAGFRAVKATGAPVVTSSRIDARAPDGYASWLHRGGLIPEL